MDYDFNFIISETGKIPLQITDAIKNNQNITEIDLIRLLKTNERYLDSNINNLYIIFHQDTA